VNNNHELLEVGQRLGFSYDEIESLQLLAGPCRAMEICRWRENEFVPTPEQQRTIEERWSILRAEKPRVFNGLLANVCRFEVVDGILRFELSMTDYKTYMGLIGLLPGTVNLSSSPCLSSVLPLSFGAIIITTDNKIIAGIRGNKAVGQFGRLHALPSGYFSPHEHIILKERIGEEGGTPSLLVSIASELLQELNLQYYSGLEILGLIQDGINSKQPLIALRILVPYTAEEVIEKSRSLRDEVTTVFAVNNTIEAVKSLGAAWTSHDIGRLIFHFAY